MAIFKRSVIIPVSPEEAFAWHEKEGAFERLTPPWESVRIIEKSGGITDGSWVKVAIQQFSFEVYWLLEHRNYQKNHLFEDFQIKGPFAYWHHQHRFFPHSQGTLLEDYIEYALPFNPLSKIIEQLIIAPKLKKLFTYRHQLTLADLSSS